MTGNSNHEGRRPWPLSLILLLFVFVYAGLHLVPGLGLVLLVLGSYFFIPLLVLGVFVAILVDVVTRRISPFWLVLPALLGVFHVMGLRKSSSAIDDVRKVTLAEVRSVSGWDRRALDFGTTQNVQPYELLDELGVERVSSWGYDGTSHTSFLSKEDRCLAFAGLKASDKIVKISPIGLSPPYASGDCMITVPSSRDPKAAVVDLQSGKGRGHIRGHEVSWTVTKVTLPGGSTSSFRHGEMKRPSSIPLQISMGRDHFPWKVSEGISSLNAQSIDDTEMRGALQVLGFARKLRMKGRNQVVYYGLPRRYLDPASATALVMTAVNADRNRLASEDALVVRGVEDVLAGRCDRVTPDLYNAINERPQGLAPMLPRIAVALRDDTRLRDVRLNASTSCLQRLVDPISNLDPSALRTVARELREAISISGETIAAYDSYRSSDPGSARRRIMLAVGNSEPITEFRRSEFRRIQTEMQAHAQQAQYPTYGQPASIPAPPVPYWLRPEFQAVLDQYVPFTEAAR